MNEIAQRYQRRAAEFGRNVAAVRPDRWEDQSPCEKWTARDVVRHAVDMHHVMLRPVEREPSPAPSVDEDPVAAFAAARADVQALLDDPELARILVDTPGGKVTVADHVDKVVSDDLVLHGWDLAKATGHDDTMDPDDVTAIWAYNETLDPDFVEMLHTPGAFGPDVEVFGPVVPIPQDAPLQHRLLGSIGRDPHWAPPAGG